MAANKSDLFDKEQVSEAEARKYASEIGAIFKLTSACTANGIEDLFRSIGCKFLDPNYKDDDTVSGVNTGSSGAQNNQGGSGVKLDPKKTTTQKKEKKCC